MDQSVDLDTNQYDVIICTDLLKELATMDLRFSNNTICWDDLTIPMRDGGTKDRDHLLYVPANEKVESDIGC